MNFFKKIDHYLLTNHLVCSDCVFSYRAIFGVKRRNCIIMGRVAILVNHHTDHPRKCTAGQTKYRTILSAKYQIPNSKYQQNIIM